LTDGSLYRQWRSCWRVSFYLAGNEGELVEKVSGYLRLFGWKPEVRPPVKCNYFTVRVSGSRSTPPFPDKKQFLSPDFDVWAWLSGEGLDGKLSVPFVAGLLDGDGYCRASFHGRGAFGHVDARWSFTQKNYPFLAEFLLRYLGGVSPRSSVEAKGRRGVHEVLVLSAGRRALLERGIAKWSFKVAKFLDGFEVLKRRVEEARSRFLTPNQVAKKLHVDCTTVLRWCRLGFVKHVEVRGACCKARHYKCLIPVEEVQRLAGLPKLRWVRRRRAD
jgi:hypothetical protein